MEKIWLKSYPEGIPADVDTKKYQNIVEILENSFGKYAASDAFHNMGKTLTYREIEWKSRKVASYFQNDLKLKKGDRIAIMMPNLLQYPIALFAALRAGLVVVNVNPLYTARELQHQLVDSQAKAILIFTNSAHILQKILPETSVEHVMVTNIGDMLGVPKSFIVNFVIKHIKKMVPPWDIK
ncbi:MAG: AMP-binding protein, partial [Halobacteriovoraceae bacterium]|nr:AMP-binding protein [Halobacteriovoraceae bacterium]